MQTSLRKAVAAACLVLSAGAVHAAAAPLQNAVISASYNGAAGAMLGIDHDYFDHAGSNVSALDPFNTSVEFFTNDFLFGFDFAADGTLTIYNNYLIPAGSYQASFDFGATLGAAIAGFSVTDSGFTTGTPVLTIVNDHTIAIDLSSVDWNGEFNTLQTAITLQGPTQPVPEPATLWMLLAGLAGLRLLPRRR